MNSRDRAQREANRTGKAVWYTTGGWWVYPNAKRVRDNRARREKHRALTDLGLKRVRGALGGVYYE